MNQVGFSFTAEGLREANPEKMEVHGGYITVKQLVNESDLMLFPGTYYVSHVNYNDLIATFRARVLPGPRGGWCYLPERHPRGIGDIEDATVLSSL